MARRGTVEVRSAHLNMRMTHRVKEAIREEADRVGLTISQYIEEACLQYIAAGSPARKEQE